MEAAFETLKKTSFNTVDNLVKWMKDAKIVESTAEGEAKARKMFEDAKADAQNVNLSQFKEVVTNSAAAQNKNVDEFFTSLLKSVPTAQVQQAASAAAAALADAAGLGNK